AGLSPGAGARVPAEAGRVVRSSAGSNSASTEPRIGETPAGVPNRWCARRSHLIYPLQGSRGQHGRRGGGQLDMDETHVAAAGTARVDAALSEQEAVSGEQLLEEGLVVAAVWRTRLVARVAEDRSADLGGEHAATHRQRHLRAAI